MKLLEELNCYRGKDLVSQKWVEGQFIYYPHMKKGYMMMYNELKRNMNCPIQVDIATVGRFAGFYDKIGKKIFEGDIVKGTYVTFDGDVSVKGKVVFNDGSFKVCSCVDGIKNAFSDVKCKTVFYSFNELRCRGIELLGNIHESDRNLSK